MGSSGSNNWDRWRRHLRRPPPQINHSPILTALFQSQAIAHTIPLCQYSISLKLTTALNGPFKVGPMIGRIREIALYIYSNYHNNKTIHYDSVHERSTDTLTNVYQMGCGVNDGEEDDDQADHFVEEDGLVEGQVGSDPGTAQPRQAGP